MKTLIVIIHPNLKDSVVNKRWIEELNKYPNQYTLHNLHDLYPDQQIDIEKEHKVLEAHDKIIFQFPLYWFSSPPFFKKWLDEVFIHGWAFGKESEYRLANKKVALAITVGIDQEDYCAEGRYNYTLDQVTAPFELAFNYVKADYRPLFAFYGAEHHPTQVRIEENTQDYMLFLQQI